MKGDSMIRGSFVATLAFVASLFVHGDAFAVFNINVPSPKTVTPDNRAVAVNWTMTTDDNLQPILSLDPGQIESPAGQILAFTGTFSVGPGSFAYAFSDNFLVPASVIDVAIDQGFAFLNYVRFFGQGAEIPLQRTVRIDIGSLLTGGSVRPSPVAVVPGADNVFDLEWRVDLAGSTAVVTSNDGRFRTVPGGAVIGNAVNRRLRTSPGAGPRLRERLVVPAALVAAAARQGLRRIVYTRDFGAAGSEVRIALDIDILDALTRVTGTGGAARLASGRAGTVPLRWTAEFSRRGGVRNLTLRSTGGRFLAPDGRQLGVFAGDLSRPGVGNGNVMITENLLVPAAISVRARQNGHSAVLVERVFSDGLAQRRARLRLPIVGAAGAGFNVGRVDLHFPDFSRIKVVEGGDDVTVVADLTTTGSGLIDAAWEVASPPPGGPLLFRTVSLVKQFVSGAGRKRLTSPSLPALQPGLHVVRLRIDGPAFAFEPPMVRYYVGLTEAGAVIGDDAMRPIFITAPAPGTLIADDTRFQWRALDGIDAYVLELYPLGREPLPPPGANENRGDYRQVAAGLVVSGEESDAALSRLVSSYLVAGEAYQWRVVAIGNDGRYVGESDTGVIRVPE